MYNNKNYLLKNTKTKIAKNQKFYSCNSSLFAISVIEIWALYICQNKNVFQGMAVIDRK